MNPKFAILVDGGFITKTLSKKIKAFPTAAQIEAECLRVRGHKDLAGLDLLRIYFYDSPPATGKLKNPIDGSLLDLSQSAVFNRNTQLLNDLELLPDFSVRKGELVARGWKIGKRALQKLLKKPAAPTAVDLQPNIQQKGVDLRIGLDIARMALRGTAQVVVAVTGDSDLIPAFKFARREGMRVYLDHLGSPVRRELKVHVDRVI